MPYKEAFEITGNSDVRFNAYKHGKLLTFLWARG